MNIFLAQPASKFQKTAVNHSKNSKETDQKNINLQLINKTDDNLRSKTKQLLPLSVLTPPPPKLLQSPDYSRPKIKRNRCGYKLSLQRLLIQTSPRTVFLSIPARCIKNKFSDKQATSRNFVQ